LNVSIIVPCYNIQQHLPKCIDSVLDQTYTDFEVILVNDGSEDNTLKICEDYRAKDARIKVLTHENRGASYSRNRALAQAGGEYIMFIDGDDWIEKEMLAVLVVDSEDPTIMNICGMVNEKEGHAIKNPFYQKLLEIQKDKIYKNSFITLLENYQISSPCCKLYHKSIITNNNLKFDEKISYQEDIVFNLMYFKHLEAVRLKNFFGYHYIQHIGSSSSRYHKYFGHISNLMLQLRQYAHNECQEKVIRVFILDTLLKAMSNIAHTDSPNSKIIKIKEYKTLLMSDEFNYCVEQINYSTINSFFKRILLLRNEYLIYAYYLLNRYLK
jgi:glycosyltransferase involved in cell wall biosynthesis